MRPTTAQLHAVLLAAQRVLAARADQMLTSEEWDALAKAVAGCEEPVPRAAAAAESFRVEDGVLIRSVIPKRGRGEPYEHACTLEVFEAVCHAVDELDGGATALDDLVARTGLPHSQVNTALAFLKERGCLVPARGRRHAAARGGGGVHLDAMTEYHAIKDGSPGSAAAAGKEEPA